MAGTGALLFTLAFLSFGFWASWRLLDAVETLEAQRRARIALDARYRRVDVSLPVLLERVRRR